MRGLILLALAVFPLSAVAQECDRAETTLAMGACLQEALGAADAELNRTYRLAMEGAQGGDGAGTSVAAALKAAQRAWITYRDLACAAEAANYGGGSLAPIARAGCLLRLTNERVAELSEFLPD